MIDGIRVAKFVYNNELDKWDLVISYWYSGNHYRVEV